ncbi:MAG: PKD domain-containing protein [Candidatus Azobacteroides sp.]|nr:PKD domain-containing protein [Candidatus Azobacteroides sp.]
MKRIILSVFALLAILSFVFADGDGPQAVSIIKDGGAVTFYKFAQSDPNWWENPLCNGSNPSYSVLNDKSKGGVGLDYFNDINLGAPESLILDGGAMVAWGPSYTSSTYQLQYRVYKTGAVAPAWSSFPVDQLAGQDGQDIRYEVHGKNINILALTNGITGTYRFEVCLKVKGSDESIQTATFSYVGTDVAASFNAPVSGFANEPVAFINTSVNATSYSWDFGDGASSKETNPDHTYVSEGTYTVTLIAENDANETSSATSTIKIYDRTNPPSDELLVNGTPLTQGIWSVSTLGYATPATLTWDYTVNEPTGSVGDALRIQTPLIANQSSGIAIYQPVTLTAGHRYEFNCLFKDLTGAAEGMWFQIYITTENPSNTSDLAIAQEAVQGSGVPTIGELTSWGENWLGSPKGYDGPFKDQAIKGKLHTGDLCVFTPISSGIYNFIIRTGSWNNRMDIAISDLSLKDLDLPTGCLIPKVNDIKIYSQDRQIQVVAESDMNNVFIYNLNGKIVDSTVSAGNRFTSIELSSGLYLLNIGGKGYKVLVK